MIDVYFQRKRRSISVHGKTLAGWTRVATVDTVDMQEACKIIQDIGWQDDPKVTWSNSLETLTIGDLLVLDGVAYLLTGRGLHPLAIQEEELQEYNRLAVLAEPVMIPAPIKERSMA